VTQTQGNHNLNVSPAVAAGPPILGAPVVERLKGETGPKGLDGRGPGASTWNAQGNGNEAFALVAQSNRAWQSQTAWQTQGSRACGCTRW
jgi:hypothetical protein